MGRRLIERQNREQIKALAPQQHIGRKAAIHGEVAAVRLAPIGERKIALPFGGGKIRINPIKSLLAQRHRLEHGARTALPIFDNPASAHGGAFDTFGRTPAGRALFADQDQFEQFVGQFRPVTERKARQGPPIGVPA